MRPAAWDQENNPSASLLTARDRAKSLLPRRVPYLQFDPFVFEQQFFDFKVDPYRGDEGARKAILGEPQQQARLANT